MLINNTTSTTWDNHSKMNGGKVHELFRGGGEPEENHYNGQHVTTS